MSWRMLTSTAFRILAAIIDPKNIPLADNSMADVTGPSGGDSWEGDEEDFKVYSYSLFYVHTSYLSTALSSLEDAATKLVATDFGLLASLPDGRCFWKNGQKVTSGTLETEPNLDHTRACIKFPQDLANSLKYQAMTAAFFRSTERKIFGDHSILERYIRVFLPSLRLLVDEEEIDVTVQIKVFESGIAQMLFQVEETGDFDLDSFIQSRVNLGHHHLSAVEVSPEFAYLTLDAATNEVAEIKQRKRILELRKILRRDHPIQSRSDGCKYVRFVGNETTTLLQFGSTIASTLAYCLGQPRQGIPFLLRGEPSEPRSTGFWNASPHVHLLAFSDQSISAEENQRTHHDAFVRILSRTPTTAGRLVSVPLPDDLRAFDDLGFYANEAMLLFAHSAREEVPEMDGTADAPLYFATYEWEVKGETIELIPMLYRSLLHELETKNLAWDHVLSIWERVTNLELSFDEAGRYGDVREMLRKAVETRGTSRLRELTERRIDLRGQVASVTESRQLSSTGTTFSLVLGFLALPGLIEFISKYIVNPLVKDLYPQPYDLLFSSSLAILIPMLLLRWITSRANSHDQIHWHSTILRD